MVSVPRLYNRFYDVIKQKINEQPFYKRTLVEWGLSSKINTVETYGYAQSSVYDKLVFDKFK